MPFIFTLKIQAKAKEFVLMGFPERLRWVLCQTSVEHAVNDMHQPSQVWLKQLALRAHDTLLSLQSEPRHEISNILTKCWLRRASAASF